MKYQVCDRYRGLSKDLSETPKRLRFEITANHDLELERTDNMQEKTIITMNHDKDFCSQFSFTIQDRPYANKIASLPIELTSKLLEDESRGFTSDILD